MKKNNQDVRDLLKECGVIAADVATMLGMFASNFNSMMRLPLKPERKAQILAIIDELTKGAK